MDFLTAGISVVPVLLCMAFAMLGIWQVDRKQAPGAQLWAVAVLLLCAGVTIIVLTDNGKNQPALLILANSCVVGAAVLQHWGLRRFFDLPRERLASALGIGFFLLYSACIFTGAAAARVMVFCAAIVMLMCLSLACVMRGLSNNKSLGARIIKVALGMLIADYLLRMVVTLLTHSQVHPTSRSILPVVLIYIVPMVGTVLYTVGLLMLYFERSLREQRHLATHDALTGIFNRRAVVEAGEAILAEAIRADLPLSVALVDIDHFKRVNDQLGHHAGDQVLVDVARLLSAQCRRRDVLGRYGGEEFLLVCAELPADDCASFGERLLESMHHYRYQVHHPVTISVGFAWRLEGDNWHSLTSRADAELYRAKTGGRNRYCIPGKTDPVPAASASAFRSEVDNSRSFADIPGQQ